MTGAREIRLGIIADTHGLYDPAVECYFSGVSEILHAGDIGRLLVLTRLERLAPVVAVSGNVDGYERSGRPRHVLIRRGGMIIAIRHVLYAGGTMVNEAKTWLDKERPAVCIFGHSHRPTIARYGETLLVNPGSAGPKRFSLPRGIGLLVIAEGRVTPSLIALPDKRSGNP